MDRLRSSIRALTPAQQGTLGLLAALVLLATGVLIVTLAAPDEDRPLTADGDPTTTSPPAPTTSTTVVTTTTASVADTTTTTTEPTTTTTLAPERELVLRPDGIGGSYFGDRAGPVFDALVAVLGEPDEDTGWVDQLENYGTCLGSEVRFVRWRSLNVFFTDGPSDWAPAETRHLASYTQASFFGPDPLDLVTSDGVTLGTRVGDVRARYGDEAVVDDEIFGPLWIWDPPGSAYQWGEVSGTAPEDTVLSISGGFACGE